MKRLFLTVLLIFAACLTACDAQVKSQLPSHIAEFSMPTNDYPKLLAALDSAAALFNLKRFDAGPLKRSDGQKELFAAYRPDYKGSPAALDLADVKGPGKVWLRVYGDYFTDVNQREKFIAEVAAIVQRHGGKLTLNESATQKPKP